MDKLFVRLRLPKMPANLEYLLTAVSNRTNIIAEYLQFFPILLTRIFGTLFDSFTFPAVKRKSFLVVLWIIQFGSGRMIPHRVIPHPISRSFRSFKAISRLSTA